MIIVGSLKKRKDTISKYLLSICIAVIQPVQMQYELLALKLLKRKLLSLNDITMAPNFKEVVMKIKCLEEEIMMQARLHLGLESIFQLASNAILLSYAHSRTRARQGLSSLFDKDINFFMGLSLPPELVIGTLLAINFLSFIKAQMNGMIEGYASNYAILGKVALFINVICATLLRIASMTLYFSTTLGSFDLLHHYQGEQYQF
jgi:hypothetical protein